MLILLNCEPVSLTVFTTMCPKEQQTSDDLIVKDYCFIIEIFDKGGGKKISVAHGTPRLGQSVSNLAQRLPATSYFNCYHFFGIMMHYNTSFGIFFLRDVSS